MICPQYFHNIFTTNPKWQVVTGCYCGGAKTWALALGLSLTFYQQYVRGEEIMGEPRN